MNRPEQRPSTERDVELLATALMLTGVRPVWSQATDPRSTPLPAGVVELLDLARDLTVTAHALALVTRRLMAGRRDGHLTPGQVAVLLPVVTAFQQAAATDAAEMTRLANRDDGTTGAAPT